MSKHTPGPWEAKGYWSNPNTDTLVWDKEAAICHVFPRSEMASLSEETRTANARLIAAAPDLLACCIRALNESARVHPDFEDQLRAAIAKAQS